MGDDLPPLTANSASEARERSLVEDLRQLAQEGRAAAEAEIAYQKSRAAVAGQGMKAIAALGALALVLLVFALMALVFGVVLALAELVGAWAATAIVVLGLILAAGLCAMLAGARWKALSRRLTDNGPGDV